MNTATKTATCFQNLCRALYQRAQNLRMEKPFLTDKEIHEELFKEFNPSKVNHEGLGDAEPFLPPYNTI